MEWIFDPAKDTMFASDSFAAIPPRIRRPPLLRWLRCLLGGHMPVSSTLDWGFCQCRRVRFYPRPSTHHLWVVDQR